MPKLHFSHHCIIIIAISNVCCLALALVGRSQSPVFDSRYQNGRASLYFTSSYCSILVSSRHRRHLAAAANMFSTFDLLQSVPPSSVAVAASVGLLTLFVGVFLHRQIRTTNIGGSIPQARDGSPFIGHALAYKKNPAAFLIRQAQTVGSVFRINLAGRRMVVLTCGGASESEMQQVKTAMTLPESQLSARDAVADIGFEYTLGRANVYEGTDFHKRLIKKYLNKADTTVPLLFSALQNAYRLEVDEHVGKDGVNRLLVHDFLGLVRRCTIRAVVSVFLGSSMLRSSQDDFLDNFMLLQDAIEEATAAAAVLPKFLSLPLILRPVERSRIKLQKDIARRISLAWSKPEKDQGPWLKEFRSQGISVDKAAEFVVGLLFAAHKNPAIGSAQAYLYVMLKGTDQERLAVKKEAAAFISKPTNMALDGMCHLRRCCLETLRLTAHALGAVRTAREEVSLCKCPMKVGPKNKCDESAGSEREIRICPGEVIAVSHIAPSLNTTLWGDNASNYDPNRKEWTDQDVYPSEYKFSAFSQGLHRCPGQKAALNIMQINLAILSDLYSIEFVGEVPDISFERATLAQRDGNVCVRIAPTSTNTNVHVT